MRTGAGTLCRCASPISLYHGAVISPAPRSGEKITRMPVSFPDDLYEWMRETAFKRRIPMAELVREALREYRERVEPQLDLWTGGRDERDR